MNLLTYDMDPSSSFKIMKIYYQDLLLLKEDFHLFLKRTTLDIDRFSP